MKLRCGGTEEGVRDIVLDDVSEVCDVREGKAGRQVDDGTDIKVDGQVDEWMEANLSLSCFYVQEDT